MTTELEDEILALRVSGESEGEIARRLGCSPGSGAIDARTLSGPSPLEADLGGFLLKQSVFDAMSRNWWDCVTNKSGSDKSNCVTPRSWHQNHPESGERRAEITFGG
jgi:hypothetical protein